MFTPKSMRPIEEIMADFDDGKELSPEEERLADSVVFEKTGKRTSKFSKVEKRVEPMSVNKSVDITAVEIPVVSQTITKDTGSDSKALRSL